MKYAIGVVIDRDLFPDKLFAPAKRLDLMPDGTNPVLDKELRSEIFSQGTLMLRVVIQVSMLLSIPLMAGLLFLRSDKAAYYVGYVITFNLLVGPVFSSGSITQERERQTLGLLLTTLLRPGKIVFAKLLAALRVSTVLTFLLTEQLLLAYFLLPELRSGSGLPRRLPPDHRNHLPGDLDDRSDVFLALAQDVGGDGHDLHDPARPLRRAGRLGVVPRRLRVDHGGATRRPDRDEPLFRRAQRADARLPLQSSNWSDAAVEDLRPATLIEVVPGGRLGVAWSGPSSSHLYPPLCVVLLRRHLPGLPAPMVAGGGDVI